MRFSSIKWVVLPLIFIVFFFLIREVWQEKSFNEIPQSVVNFFALKEDGNKTDYQHEKGKATLIVLSASWCLGCIKEIPLLKKIHESYNHQGLKILMISEDDNLKIMSKFQKEKNMPWTVVHWNYEAMNALGNPGVIPVSYLVNESNKIEKFYVGDINENDLRKRIEKILK